MIESQANKFVVLHSPGALVDNALVVTTPVDTIGFDYLDIYVVLGALDIAVAGLKLRESDDGATWTPIPESDYSNPANGQTLPSATADNLVYGFHVNGVGARKRYVDVVMQAGDGAQGTYVSVVGLLSRGKTYPSDAAGRGLAGELFV